jgi:hypothetical protein
MRWAQFSVIKLAAITRLAAKMSAVQAERTRGCCEGGKQVSERAAMRALCMCFQEKGVLTNQLKGCYQLRTVLSKTNSVEAYLTWK